MKKSSSNKRWYLETISSGSNQKIAEVLGSDVAVREESNTECADGVSRLLWEVEYGIVERAIQSLESGEYKIWCSKDNKLPKEVRKRDLVGRFPIPDTRPRVQRRVR